jgi:hypothetical protein
LCSIERNDVHRVEAVRCRSSMSVCGVEVKVKVGNLPVRSRSVVRGIYDSSPGLSPVFLLIWSFGPSSFDGACRVGNDVDSANGETVATAES